VHRQRDARGSGTAAGCRRGGEAGVQEIRTQGPGARTVELPIERGSAGPGFLADTIVRRWQDHQPLNRLEGVYARDGLELSRSTLCTWHGELGGLARPVYEAMFVDALGSPYLCVDPTGVLVLAKERCHNGSIAPLSREPRAQRRALVSSWRDRLRPLRGDRLAWVNEYPANPASLSTMICPLAKAMTYSSGARPCTCLHSLPSRR